MVYDNDRIQALNIFRNVNGYNKTWVLDNNSFEYIDSGELVHLRENQGITKSRFIKWLLSDKENKMKVIDGASDF